MSRLINTTAMTVDSVIDVADWQVRLGGWARPGWA